MTRTSGYSHGSRNRSYRSDRYATSVSTSRIATSRRRPERELFRSFGSGAYDSVRGIIGRIGLVAVIAATVALSWSEGRAGDPTNSPGYVAPGLTDYKLGPLDKVRVKVFEWRPSRDEIVPWAALNAEYTIGPNGTIALPLIGEMQAGGVGTVTLSSNIAIRLRERMGLAAAPDTVVDIVEYRPIYVVGQVEKPGEYAFRPGLSVLQALSLSGGLMRQPGTGGVRLEREIVGTSGELSLLQGERQAILARLARLRAEFQKKSEISFPDEIAGARATQSARRIADQERLVFESRSNSRATQMAALRQLKEHLGQEVASLTGQIATHKRQLALMATELDQITALTKKGLATAPRKLALERNAAQLEGDGMRLETTLQRARQEISKTDIAMIELENRRSDELTDALLQSEIRLDQVEEKLATTGALLHEAQVLAPIHQASLNRRGAPTARYAIVRARGEGYSEFEAAESTQVLPGDTVKVSITIRAEPTPALPENSGDIPRPIEPRHGAARASLGNGASLRQ